MGDDAGALCLRISVVQSLKIIEWLITGENKGKQFNPDNGASRTGPVLMIPANNSK